MPSQDELLASAYVTSVALGTPLVPPRGIFPSINIFTLTHHSIWKTCNGPLATSAHTSVPDKVTTSLYRRVTEQNEFMSIENLKTFGTWYPNPLRLTISAL